MNLGEKLELHIDIGDEYESVYIIRLVLPSNNESDF